MQMQPWKTVRRTTLWSVIAAMGLVACTGAPAGTVTVTRAGTGGDSAGVSGDVAGADGSTSATDGAVGSDASADATPTARVDVLTPDAGQDSVGTDDAAAPDADPSEGTTPDDVQPVEVQPEDVAPDVAPEDVGPGDTGPADGAPADGAPADLAPADLAPADTGPDTQPVDTAPDVAPDVAVDVPPADVAPDVPPADVKPDVVVGPCGPVNCDDGNPCTIDTCKADGQCVWSTQANTACDDGNACTKGDVCVGLKCNAGTALTDCDDKNVCTTDSCDAKSGCIHAPNDAACDDGSKCTVQDKCGAGACKGAVNACDDGKACTDDQCDAATGNCSWLGKFGACDDGNACTIGETCKTGNCGGGTPKDCDDKNVCTTDSCDNKGGCVNGAVAGNPTCDDGSVCTNKDSCIGGKCTGPGIVCDDGNVCTDDSCDPKTGQCVPASNAAACVGADKCMGPGTCKNGGCLAGTAAKNCDDKNNCTADSCEATTGNCLHKAANDGAVCDDGIACTKESKCAGGGCKPTVGCLIFADSFECSANPTFAVVVPPPSGNNPPRKVMWHVDQTPVIGALAGMGCALNYNDGTDYCDSIGQSGGNNCQFPLGTATSPLLDFTATGGLSPQLTMDTYYDVDNSSANDTPRIRVIEEGTNTELKNVLLPKQNGDLKVLKKGYVLAMPEAQGKKVRIQFSLNFGGDSSTGNSGAGWFVDNVSVQAVTGLVELCGNGLDDNFNGLTDCADAACKSLNLCVEVCNDAKDNDADGATDCTDTDCSTSLACVKPLYRWGFDICTNDGWSYTPSPGGNISWAVDATPDIGPLPYGACTLNFNNGKNYCTGANCQGNSSASGRATLNQPFDLPAGKKITLSASVYLAVEDANSANGAAYDNTWLEISSNGFACAQAANCPSQNNPYTAVISYQLPRDQPKTWVLRQVDVSSMAGKTATLRVRFDSGDPQYNDFPGPFLDEIKIHAL